MSKTSVRYYIIKLSDNTEYFKYQKSNDTWYKLCQLKWIVYFPPTNPKKISKKIFKTEYQKRCLKML